MRLKTKLFLGYASILAIMVVLFGISINNLDLSNKNVDKAQQERYQKIKFTNTVQSEINNISRYNRDLILLDVDSHDISQTINSIRASRREVASALDSLEASAIPESTKNLLRQIKTSNLDYTKLQENCIALASSGKKAEAIRAIKEGAVVRGQIFEYVGELNNLEDKAMDDLLKSSVAGVDRAIKFFFFSLLLTLLAGVVITAWIIQRVTRDIHKVTAVMNHVSSIQEHVNLQRINIHSKDEVGEIAASFNGMAQSLEEHATQEKKFIEKIEGQNWLKSGIAEINDLCQGVQDLETLAHLLITKIPPMVEASYGIFYIREGNGDKQCFKKLALYAGSPLETAGEVFRPGELENIKSALEEKARQLEESSTYKTEFLSNMSHELRTPLNSLLILSQTLTENQEGNLTPSQVEYVKTIFSSGNELLSLINDILDLSKVEAGKISINSATMELAKMKDYVERCFLPVARQKKLDFIVQMSEDLPDTTCMDEHLLLQILKNLLSNAFKFTDHGSVSLQVRRAEEHVVAKNDILMNAEWVLAFSVTDTGIGIPKYKQDMIFEAFQQANGTIARKYGGTGLGLTISQKIARLLGGFIDHDSVEGRGSTFTLYLPSQSAEKEASGLSFVEKTALTFDDSPYLGAEPVGAVSTVEGAPDESQRVENVNARLEGKKILVVDDDMRNVFALATALENRNMQAVFAENGREGIEVLQKNRDIDLVLMDIMMPEMDGYEALQSIRQIPEYASLPIIALTAKAMKNDREKCIQAGASDYISKPVNLEQLFSLIKIWLYR